MRPSPDISGRPRRQSKLLAPGTVGGCHSCEVCLAPPPVGGVLFTDNAAIGLPLGIERVIGIGSKYTPPCYSLFLTVGHSKRCHPFYSAKNAEILLYLINYLVFRFFYVDRLVSIGQTILRKKHR